MKLEQDVHALERQLRALLYTMEIGATGFLSGPIAFEAGKAIEVHRPVLKRGVHSTATRALGDYYARR